MKNLKVKVTCHKNYVIIEVLDKKEDKNFVPINDQRIGCVLINSQKYLGMSDEAAALLKTMKKSGDDIGDVSAWKTDDGRNCFSWIGGFKRLIDMKVAESDRNGITELHYIKIKNTPPKEAVEAIDEYEKEK